MCTSVFSYPSLQPPMTRCKLIWQKDPWPGKVSPSPPSTQQSSWGGRCPWEGQLLEPRPLPGADLPYVGPLAGGACLEVIRASHTRVLSLGFSDHLAKPTQPLPPRAVRVQTWKHPLPITRQIPERGVSPGRLLSSL